MTVTLTPEAQKHLDKLMELGEFQNESQAVSEALEYMTRKREAEFIELKAKIDEGIASLEHSPSVEGKAFLVNLKKQLQTKYSI